MSNNKVVGFNLDMGLRDDLSAKIDKDKENGDLPYATSASWVVSQLIQKYVSGSVEL